MRSRSQPRESSGTGGRRQRGPVSRAPGLDHVDRGIIEALQRNGRESFRRIAATLGVSEATVRARYARLCDQSILQVTGVTNPLGLGFEAQAMVGVRTTGPRRGRTVVPRGALPCERLRNARRFLPTATHPVNEEPSRATNAP